MPVDGDGNGTIVETLEGERAYDHGRRRNWDLIMGKGGEWVWPPNALMRRVGMKGEIFNWPIAQHVLKRLQAEAMRRTGRDNEFHED